MNPNNQPIDANGHPWGRAAGLPLCRKLGLDDVMVDVWDFTKSINGAAPDKFENRSFIGLSVYNPSETAEIHIAMGDAFENVADIIVPPDGYFTFDNMSFGPAIADNTYGVKVTHIRAKMSAQSGTKASATIEYSGNPSDGETFEIGDKTYEFSADQSAAPGNIKIDILGSEDLTWAEAVDVINANDQAVTASIDTGTNTVTITSNYGGAEGNGYVVVDGDTGATFSGNLSGGTGGESPIFNIW